MGYDIHITRKEFWADEDDQNIITLDEWKNFLSTQSDMRLDNFAEARLDDNSTLKLDNPGIAVWTSYSLNGKDGNYAWFNYNDGDITVKNPDDEILIKLCSIAQQLNAFAQGDDGELYEDGKIKG